MMPQVLFLDHSGELGGAELYLIDLLQHFRHTSRTVVFQQGAFPTRLAEQNLPHTVVPAGRGLTGVQRAGAVTAALRSIPSVLKLVGKVVHIARGYDVLYANSQKALIVGGLVSVISRRPLIWNLHDILTAGHFSNINRYVAILWSNLFASHVIANSHATLDAYRSSGGRAPASVVYNGIDLSRFNGARNGDVRRVRDEIGLGSRPAVGVFSRLASWKGQHILVEALQFCPDYEAVIVGDALFHEDVAYKSDLRQMVERYGLTGRVHFLGFRDDIPTVMKAMDVVAHTSTAPEPFGRVVVEGMLSGKPVIATASGGPREIIDHGETGLLVPAGDAKALANQLKVLAEDSDEAYRMAQTGRNYAANRFSLERMCNDVEGVIRQVGNR